MSVGVYYDFWTPNGSFDFMHWFDVEDVSVPRYYLEVAGGMPKDQITVEIVNVTLDSRIQWTVYAICTAVAILAVFCLSFTFVHRKKKLVYVFRHFTVNQKIFKNDFNAFHSLEFGKRFIFYYLALHCLV